MNQQLASHLKFWDGVHMDSLKSIYERKKGEAGFLNEIISLLKDHPELEIQTTWLLKHHLDTKGKFSEEQLEEIYLLFPKCSDWAAQLHLLQMIPVLNLKGTLLLSIEDPVQELLDSKNKFLKAAAYEAFYCLCKSDPLKLQEFILRVQSALEFESASVKVKLRRILKEQQV